MIKIIEGNILNAPENIICQQVNCQGIMGSGLALQIMKKYPDVYPRYKKYCKDFCWGLIGSVCYVKTNDKIIANLFGQEDYGRSKKVYTNYVALEKALVDVKIYADNHDFSVAIPYGIGCGLANGNWAIVRDMIERTFSDYDVTIYKLV